MTGTCREACIEVYLCRGHPNVSLRHESTLELSEEDRLTPRGDCIACIELRPLTSQCSLRLREAYAALYIMAVDPDGHRAVYKCSGYSPADPRGTGHVARRSWEPARSMIVGSDCSAASLRRVLEEGGVDYRSPFTRFMVLLYYIACSVDTVDEPPRGVIENPPDTKNPAPPLTEHGLGLPRLPGDNVDVEHSSPSREEPRGGEKV